MTLHTLYWAAIGFVPAIVVASFFEWFLHRYIMHRRVPGFEYPFRAHAMVHHRIFKADHTYHLIQEEDKMTIPMAWWNGPVLVAVCQSPFILVSWLVGEWGILVGACAAIACYFATYEYLHWCMHLPRQRRIERSGIFFRLNGHHILHHRYMDSNLNVVLPLADFCLGTLVIRSKIPFPQPKGPSVPNLQPTPERRSLPRRVFGFLRLCVAGVKTGSNS